MGVEIQSEKNEMENEEITNVFNNNTVRMLSALSVLVAVESKTSSFRERTMQIRPKKIFNPSQQTRPQRNSNVLYHFEVYY